MRRRMSCELYIYTPVWGYIYIFVFIFCLWHGVVQYLGLHALYVWMSMVLGFGKINIRAR